jgi:four helix bundle protein
LTLPENSREKVYDLGKRTLTFARLVRTYVNELPKNTANLEYSKQLVRSSGSIGANYIEAEDALSKKDFGMRIKISRKEAKESWYWLELTEPHEAQFKEKEELLKEAIELTKIFGAIVEKTKKV